MCSRQRGIILFATLLGVGVAFQTAAVHAEVAMAAASDSAFASEDSTAADPLAASTAAPWNPAAEVPTEERWEIPLRIPGLILGYPFRVLGKITDQALIFADQIKLIPRTIALVQIPAQHGLILRPASLGDRTGLGLNVKLAPTPIKRFFAAEWDGTTNHYNRTTLRAGYEPAWLEYQYEWRPEDRFFGLGLDSSKDDKSNYAAHRQQVKLAVSQPLFPSRRFQVTGWVGERQIAMRGGKEDGGRSFEEVFPALGVLIDRQQDHLFGGASVVYDDRAGVPHWTHGIRMSTAAEWFTDRGRELLFESSGAPSEFTRLRYDFEGGFSFFRTNPRTIRLSARVVDQHMSEGTLLFPDLALLGGSQGLAGYEPGRFHDLDLALGKLMYIFPIGKHLELDVHTEAGGVYGDVWKQARLSDLKHSYGVALRPRTDTAVVGSFGVDWSTESVRLRYSIGAVE